MCILRMGLVQGYSEDVAERPVLPRFSTQFRRLLSGLRRWAVAHRGFDGDALLGRLVGLDA